MSLLDLLLAFWAGRREAAAEPIEPPSTQTAPSATGIPVLAVGDPGWVSDDDLIKDVKMNKLPFAGAAQPLGPMDLRRAALTLGAAAGGVVDTATVEAVMMTESAGDGFLSDGSGRSPILFEAHRFSKLTKGRYDRLYPTLSTPVWNRKLYFGGAREYERLEAAIKLDRASALKATSWGAFQILGENYGLCGYGDVEAFVAAMAESEGDQLDAFVQFVISKKLARHLVTPQNWDKFAEGYNGTGYRLNNYHIKLPTNYRLALGAQSPAGVLRIGSSGDQVKMLQTKLNQRGAKLVADGLFGRATQIAVEVFQEANHLDTDGVVGPATWAALG